LLLCAIFAIAGYARFVWLPSIERSNPKAAAWRPMRVGVSWEFTLAVLLVLAATICASAIPAKHATIEYWPYPFRFSIAATWDLGLAETMRELLIAAVLCTAAVSLGFAWRRVRFRWHRTVLGAILTLAISGIALSLYANSTRASVDSYRSTVVPFDAISIARGASLFAANCTPCHGLQGRGDGPLAPGLAKKPIDLLTEPHTAQHQVGDFYNWIGVGFPGGMPGFGDRLSEDDRWDIVNYLHVVTRGYESRTLTPRVVPERPAKTLSAPNFSFTDQNGVSRTLKDYRQKQSVLLVFFTWPEDKARLETIRSEYQAIKNSGTEVIAISWRGQTPDASWAREMPFPVVQDASDIGRTYEGFRRTIANPDLFGAGEIPPHMELLVDRFGYLRGRWMPQQDSAGWSDGEFLSTQLQQLQREPQILPPAEDHVH
jgi:putative copper resistance protein D